MKKVKKKLFIKKFFKITLFYLSYSPKLAKLEKIRTQRNKEYWDLHGFGSTHIKNLPSYNFFKKYLKNPDKAKIDYINWYNTHFKDNKGWNIPKKKGGWLGGSLYKEVNVKFQKFGVILNSNNLSVYNDLVEEAMLIRVNHYFNLFKSIKENGYNPSLQPIKAKKSNGLYYLLNGHHRIAILFILGYKNVQLLKITKFESLLNKIRFLKKFLPTIIKNRILKFL